MKLKLRVRSKLPAALVGRSGIFVVKDGLTYYLDLDFQAIANSLAQTQQIITADAVVSVAATDGLIAMNKGSGAATTVNLPLAASKIGPVKISDWKGDAGTNNITVNASGTDKLNGNRTSWTIAADGASVVFTPLNNGSGYAV